ncbi:MAG: hypothetical protein Q8R02_21275 [Hyphomonadaceae bacterium]|nr:hypothetical protein [Hyphomonadaceae bacterium]
MKTLVSILAVLGFGVACAEEVAHVDPNELRVALFKDGRIEANGQPVTLAQLGDALDKAKSNARGSVAYYREGGDSDPSPEALPVITAVMGTIMDRSIPIRLSSRADFSDAIDEEGRSTPLSPDRPSADVERNQ